MRISSKGLSRAKEREVDLRKWREGRSVYKLKELYMKLLGRTRYAIEFATVPSLRDSSFRRWMQREKTAPSSTSCPGPIPKAARCSASRSKPDRTATRFFSGAHTRDLPERGRIGIFNRSYYEEVLIARVHPEILRNKAIPDSPQIAVDPRAAREVRFSIALVLKRRDRGRNDVYQYPMQKDLCK